MYRFNSLQQLIDHLNQFHEEKIEVNNYSFENMEDFEAWKKEERKSRSLFVQRSAAGMQGLNCKKYLL